MEALDQVSVLNLNTTNLQNTTLFVVPVSRIEHIKSADDKIATLMVKLLNSV